MFFSERQIKSTQINLEKREGSYLSNVQKPNLIVLSKGKFIIENQENYTEPYHHKYNQVSMELVSSVFLSSLSLLFHNISDPFCNLTTVFNRLTIFAPPNIDL
jgi:hypothetical protein